MTDKPTQAEIEALADHIMKIDGDRDHMNQSRLTCEMTQAVARHLYALSRPAPPPAEGGQGA